jgi:hypothetical protein
LELAYGVGLWRLDSTGNHDFEGVWLKVRPALDFEFEFLANGADVFGVKGVGFEDNKPPVFYRQG